MLAEVGPVTLTTDPRLFQRRLRELHVQVGILSPTVLSLVHGPWHSMGSLALHPCMVVGLRAVPGVPWECGGARG